MSSSKDHPIMNTNSRINEDQQCISLRNVNVPMQVMIRVGQYLDVRQLNSLSQCNSLLLKLYFNLNVKELRKDSPKDEKKDECTEFETVQRLIWKRLVISYYPKFKKSLNIKNWMHVLRRRLNHVGLYKNSTTNEKDMFKLDIPTFVESKKDEMMIENCEWLYKCPLSFENLDDSTSINIRFCKVCRKKVYKVYSMQELMSNVEQGHCIAYSSNVNELYTSSMGSCAPPPPRRTLKKKPITKK